MYSSAMKQNQDPSIITLPPSSIWDDLPPLPALPALPA